MRFYSGLFEEGEYSEARKKSLAIFPFVRGSDATGHEELREVRADTQYRVVLRVGAFAPGGRVRLGLWKAVPVAAAGQIRERDLREDPAAELGRSKWGRAYFTGIAAVVIVIALWLLTYDFYVIGLANRTAFFNALSAEGNAVLAVSIVLGGLFAAWREWVFPRRTRGPHP